MKKKGNNKGITLIALVITIIIMIILVAVSVTVAIKGDLFGNAQEGTDQTKIEAEKEQLTEYVYGQYKQNKDTKKVEVNLEEVKSILDGDKDKWENSEVKEVAGEDILFAHGKQTNKWYEIHKNGEINEIVCENDKLIVAVTNKSNGNKEEYEISLITSDSGTTLGEPVIKNENTITEQGLLKKDVMYMKNASELQQADINQIKQAMSTQVNFTVENCTIWNGGNEPPNAWSENKGLLFCSDGKIYEIEKTEEDGWMVDDWSYGYSWKIEDDSVIFEELSIDPPFVMKDEGLYQWMG